MFVDEAEVGKIGNNVDDNIDVQARVEWISRALQ